MAEPIRIDEKSALDAMQLGGGPQLHCSRAQVAVHL
jgi:hypothetical protein